MRIALLIVLGLVIGIAGTVMAMNALNQGPHLDHALMHMQAFHVKALETNVGQTRCAATDSLPHLQALRLLSNDIEPIFAVGKDQAADFGQKASNLRASLDAALATPPTDCTTLGAAMTRIGSDCKACHQTYKH